MEHLCKDGLHLNLNCVKLLFESYLGFFRRLFMSSTVDLVKKKRVLIESIDTGNAPNKTIDEIRKNETGAFLHTERLI